MKFSLSQISFAATWPAIFLVRPILVASKAPKETVAFIRGGSRLSTENVRPIVTFRLAPSSYKMEVYLGRPSSDWDSYLGSWWSSRNCMKVPERARLDEFDVTAIGFFRPNLRSSCMTWKLHDVGNERQMDPSIWKTAFLGSASIPETRSTPRVWRCCSAAS